jgi:hypothetical protein
MAKRKASKAGAIRWIRSALTTSTSARLNSGPQCKKEAVTDALKRSLRLFGSLLGNCLYDKHYVGEVAKMKAPKVCSPGTPLHPLMRAARPNLIATTCTEAVLSLPFQRPMPR